MGVGLKEYYYCKGLPWEYTLKSTIILRMAMGVDLK